MMRPYVRNFLQVILNFHDACPPLNPCKGEVGDAKHRTEGVSSILFDLPIWPAQPYRIIGVYCNQK